MPDGKTILMSAGTKVYFVDARRRRLDRSVRRRAAQSRRVSRLAVSPKGDAIAIVVAEPERNRSSCAVRHASRRYQHRDREDRGPANNPGGMKENRNGRSVRAAS